MTLTVTDPAEDQVLTEFAERLRKANREELLDMLRKATPAQAVEAVRFLGLRELYELPRDIVETWPGDAKTLGTARYIRAERLTTERWASGPSAMWRISDVGRAANVRSDSAGRWRTNHIHQVSDRKKCLPEPDDGIGEIKKPGDDPSSKGGSGIPLWDPSTVLRWLKWARKITDDLYPHDRARGGGIPTGRPPAQRDPE